MKWITQLNFVLWGEKIDNNQVSEIIIILFAKNVEFRIRIEK